MLFCNVKKIIGCGEKVIKNTGFILWPYEIKQRPEYGLRITDSSSLSCTVYEKKSAIFEM